MQRAERICQVIGAVIIATIIVILYASYSNNDMALQIRSQLERVTQANIARINGK